MIPQHVYLHVPFCARRCVYCDFAIAVRRNVPVADFAESVRREIDIRFADLPKSEVRTIYLGGGTPSRLGGDGIAQVLETLAARWVPADGAEVTIEANPEDVTIDTARAWQKAGVTRVSLGVQSFSPVVLTWMHRTHDVPAVERAVAALRGAGIAQLSIDLIFALPDAVERDWDYDIEQALLLSPDHISCYGLTFEDGTPLARTRLRGETHEADDGRYATEFLQVDSTLASAGFEHYEVSNYAKPGARSVHNSAYWSHVPYVGLGPSAHEFRHGVRRWNVREYTAWVNAVADRRDPGEGFEELTNAQRALESLFLGLRTKEGAARDVRDTEIVRSWEEEGWLLPSPDRLRLTPQGWLRMNALITALTQHRSRY
ncbi:MAG: radical SAM family heme chaperone HemW [Gemmatimonadaceae bacterium]